MKHVFRDGIEDLLELSLRKVKWLLFGTYHLKVTHTISII